QPLRELHRRVAAVAPPPAAALPRRLRLLPLGRRPGRRGRRGGAGPGPAPLVAPGAAALLRRPAEPPRPGGPASHHPPLPHPPGALPRPALRLRAGPAGPALPDLRAAPRLLPLLGQPGGPARALPRRGLRRTAGRPVRQHLHRPAAGQLLAGRGPRLRPGPRLPARGGPPPLRLPRRRPGGAALHPGLRRPAALRG